MEKFTVPLVVNGVADLGDYVAINQYLHTLGTVAGVTTDQLSGDRVSLTVTIVGDVNRFLQEINRQTKLVPESSPVNDEQMQSSKIYYFHWNGQSMANAQRTLQPTLVSAPSLETISQNTQMPQTSVNTDSEKDYSPEEHPVSLNVEQPLNENEEVRP